MWRISFTLLIMLNAVIAGLLFWQWNVYSEHHSKANAEEMVEVTQRISVKTNGNILEIAQIFNGLKNDKEYRAVVPETISEWNCLKEDGSPCDSSDENPYSFLADGQKMKISFQIQMEKGSSPFLLNHWTANLPDVNITETAIEVVDLNKREGIWAAGLPLKSYRELEVIDYYFFEGKGDRGSLFWQPTPLEHVRGEQNVDFYSSKEASTNVPAFEFLERIPNFSGLSIIFTDSMPETNGIGLMVANPHIENDVLERKLIYNYFSSKASDFPLEERWLIDVLTSLLTGQESKVAKGNELLAELKKVHSEEELVKFLEQVFAKNTISPEKLDELLGSLVDKKTHFFTLNRNEETKLIPLYYTDARRIVIGEKLHDDIDVLLVDGDRLFPFIETFEALGYEVKALEDNDTILLNKEGNSYRFYVSQNIFIYNEEDYGLLENPLTMINGKVYLETGWLRTIFKIQVLETSDEIKLSFPQGQ